jgi:hypothetical protein
MYKLGIVQVINFPSTLKELIQRNFSAAEMHVSRFTLQKLGAATDAVLLLRDPIVALQHALDWKFMMGALALLDPQMKIDQ